MISKLPKITLLGAGPGDPELLTIKGLRALKAADVVLYDSLISDELLSYIPVETMKICVGKRSGQQGYTQDDINRLMVDYALNYGHVLRLKGGDPFVFGRGYEELDFATVHGIPVVVIPGISSAIALAELQHIPVTHRGLSESFWVVTGTTSSGSVSADVLAAAKSNATIVVLMGLKKLASITEIFKKEKKEALPVAVIENGTTATERIVTGTVQTICARVIQAQIKAPATLIFGEVVSLHSSFQS